MKQLHWYKLYVGECPVCGKWRGYRERVYGKKPKAIRFRITYIPDLETYDNCLG